MGKLKKYSYQKVPGMKGLKEKKKSSFIFVCHHYTEAASEGRYCCSVEHTRL